MIDALHTSIACIYIVLYCIVLYCTVYCVYCTVSTGYFRTNKIRVRLGGVTMSARPQEQPSQDLVSGILLAGVI